MGNTDTTEPPIRKPRPQQTQIPGTERVVIQAIEAAALAYRDVRDERMELTKIEVAKRAALIDVMEQYETEIYKFVDGENEECTVEITTKRKVKVRKAGSKAPEDSEDA